MNHIQQHETYAKHFTYKSPLVHTTIDMSSRIMPYNSNV